MIKFPIFLYIFLFTEEFKCYSCLSFTKDTCKKEEKVCTEEDPVCLEVDYKDMGYVLQCADMDYYHGAVEDCEEFDCEVSLCTTSLCNA